MTSKYDPDGLPIWEKQEDLYVHDDPIQQAFAWGCLLEGFGLPEFDTWLSALPSCSGKTILLKRRAEAFEAGRANKHDLELRHLEFMHERMLRMMDVDNLVPLARAGKPLAEGRSKGGKNKPIPEWHAPCVRAARNLLATGKCPKDLPSILVDRFPYSRSAIDRLLKKVGIK